jgi:hypothetical protein
MRCPRWRAWYQALPPVSRAKAITTTPMILTAHEDAKAINPIPTSSCALATNSVKGSSVSSSLMCDGKLPLAGADDRRWPGRS